MLFVGDIVHKIENDSASSENDSRILVRKAWGNSLCQQKRLGGVLGHVRHQGLKDITLTPSNCSVSVRFKATGVERIILGAVRQDRNQFGSTDVVDGERDRFTATPDIAQGGKNTRDNGRVFVFQHPVKPIDQIGVLDRLLIVLIQLRDAKGGCFANIWIVILHQALQRLERRFDKLAHMDI